MGFSAGGEVAFVSEQQNRSAPVSGAATCDGSSSPEISKPSAGLPVAAPEDGRTPEAARGDSSDMINQQNARPDFQALIYPGRTQRIEPATNSPPVFLVCGYNDRPDISEGLASVYLKFKQLKVPAELHIYAGSGHGFGLRTNDPKPAAKWIERFEEWLCEHSVVPFVVVSNTANKLNGLFRSNALRLGTDEKRILIRRLAGVMSERLSEGDAGDYSRLAWLSLHLKDEDRARFMTEEGLKLDGENEHLKRLADKFSLL